MASSSEGTTIAVSATSAPDGNLTGQVQVFELSGTSWVQKGATLSGQTGGDAYGAGISLSGDGTVLAVGAPYNQSNFAEYSNSGRVYIYEWDNSVWTIKDTLNASAEMENFGYALSLSYSGDVMVVAVPGGGANKGATRIYTWTDSIYTQVGSDIIGV